MQKLPEFHAALAKWYAANGRHDLPWRKTTDPYAIWISEVMLQQTQVKTVLERFYFPFLARFPDIYTLAKADLQDVLQLWQGLGYYSRARNLHKTAQSIASQGLNTLPSNVSDLLKLPGIGQNTAHAIAALAFDLPVAVMEANVKRVLARIFSLKTINNNMLFNKANAMLNQNKPFDYNQAMMDLGAMICTPKAPKCLECPAAIICKGKSYPQAYPQRKPKAAIPIRTETIILFQNDDGYYATRPRDGRFLHGLWEFPQTDTKPASGAETIGQVKHAYSHFILEAQVVIAQKTDALPVGEWQWKTPAEIAELPLSRTEKKVLKLLKESGIVAR